nr:glycosyltransferase [Kineococcus siccus]
MPVLSTIGPGAGADWPEHVEWLPPPARRRDLPRWLAAVWTRSRGRRAVVLRGTSGASEVYRDLLAAVLLGRLRRGVRVVVSDATIEPGSRAVERALPRVGGPLARGLSRLLVRAADGPAVTWCVLSSDEVCSFPATWGVAARKVVHTPFMSTVWAVPEGPAERAGAYLFSGGNSLRDYDLLVRAVDGLGVPTVVASSWSPGRSLPAGVEVGLVSHDRFLRLLAGATAVVLPLELASRSTGQQTYLNAMWLERPVVVTDAPGVRDHVEDGVTGVVVPPEAGALRAALADVLDPSRAAHYAEMGRRARAEVEARYRDEHYRRRLLQVAGVLPVAEAAGSRT